MGAGDVVVLKSGSPKVTIVSVDGDGYCTVIFYHEATAVFVEMRTWLTALRFPPHGRQ